jgi:hypothetical protein
LTSIQYLKVRAFSLVGENINYYFKEQALSLFLFELPQLAYSVEKLLPGGNSINFCKTSTPNPLFQAEIRSISVKLQHLTHCFY